MKNLLLIHFLLSVVAVTAQQAKSTQEGTIEFISEAPLELISATSDQAMGVLDPKTGQFAFKVKIRSFEGFNSALQKEHFNENYLESEKHPFATFKGRVIESVDYDTPGRYEVIARGDLEVHGIPNEHVVDLVLYVQEDGSIEFESSFSVGLSSHDIQVPRIVYQKISETIRVNVNGILR